jgi:putative ABC transport system permease protein
LIVALVAGGWPAWRTLRRPLTGISRSPTQSTAVPARTSRVILTCELALATVVMLGTVFAGLGIWRYLHQPLGFDYADRFTISIRPSEPRQTSPQELVAAARAIRELPGVASAGPYDVAPISGIEVPGRAIDPETIAASGAAAGYFESWNLRMRAGRWFFPAEDAEAAVVDQRFAALMGPGADPIGREIRVGRGAMREVVGVIEAPRWSLIREARPTVYIPVAADTPGRKSRFVAWLPGATLPDARRQVEAAVRGAVPNADVRIDPVTFDMLFLCEVGEARFQTPFMIVFGLLAFALAGVGVFGVVSYVVERRTREFGIRLALGARSRDVWRSVTLQSVVPAIVGLAIGIAGARALERIVQATVFGWQSSGAWAVSIVAVALFAVAVAAAAAPARRAVRIDPVATLRMD